MEDGSASSSSPSPVSAEARHCGRSFSPWLVAGGEVAGLAYLCARAAAPRGRLAGLGVVLVAAVAVLNVVAALYLFGEWVCELSPAEPGASFTECRILSPLGGLSPIAAVLLLSPAGLASAAGAVTAIRDLRGRRR